MNNAMKTMRVATIAALMAGAALAQTTSTLKADVPFKFSVGNVNLPAGHYTLTTAMGSAWVMVRDAQSHVRASVLAITRPNAPGVPRYSNIVFRTRGSSHYLASAWNDFSATGWELRKSAAEREMEIAGLPETRTILIARR